MSSLWRYLSVAIEIERKFLLNDDSWRDHVKKSVSMQQGYLGGDNCSTRIRVAGDEANINVKGKTMGISRQEFEYSIPVTDAKEMLASFCSQSVCKIRHYVEHQGHLWEIDEFSGENQGLLVAEIELKDEQERFSLPSWIGKEVSQEKRYFNVCLLDNPYRLWDEKV